MITQIVGPDGLPFYLPAESNLVTHELSQGKYWEPYLLPLFPLLARSGRLIVEVGAYCGDHTIALQHLGPVLAIEPQPIPFACLAMNTALRGGTVRLIQSLIGLSSHSVVARADQQPDHPSNGWQPTSSGVPVDALDTILQSRPSVGALKIDAQGMDLLVLQGAEQTIARDRPMILAEFEPEYASAFGHVDTDYYAWFARMGYHRPRGFLGGNLVSCPQEQDLEPLLRVLQDQGVIVT